MTRTLALSGNFPREEALVKATWDLDKGLLTPAALDERRLGAARAVVELQERVGAAAVTDGNLTWQDAFRGLIESSPGFRVGGVTRLFETNRFYRQPVLVGEPTLDATRFASHLLLERLRPRAPKRAILPSPYWLYRASAVETQPNGGAAASGVAGLVNAAARWLDAKGYAEVQFQEPLLFYEPSPDLALAKQLLETALAGVRATTVVNFPNGDAAPHLAWAAQLPATAVGVDFVETHVDELKAPKKPLRLQAAVVDAQESLLEPREDLAALVGAIERRLKPAALTLTHTWDLQFLPAPDAAKKLERLAELTTKEVAA